MTSTDLLLGGLRSEVERLEGLPDAFPQPCAPDHRGRQNIIISIFIIVIVISIIAAVAVIIINMITH